MLMEAELVPVHLQQIGRPLEVPAGSALEADAKGQNFHPEKSWTKPPARIGHHRCLSQ